MAKTTIEWTNYTWNPWVGCRKVSAGCAHCYMYREQKQRGNDPTEVRRTKTWNDPLKWEKLAAASNAAAMVFTCSYSDFFIEEADQWRPEAWEIMRNTPHLHYQVLTKRIERAAQCLPEVWPMPNVWLGVTAETQAFADQRIPQLLRIPAPVRFVSVEPMLEEIDISPYMWDEEARMYGVNVNTIDWVICGAESGAGARPMNMKWAAYLKHQCVFDAVPFFFKQAVVDGKLVKMPKLDGKIWNEIPSIT